MEVTKSDSADKTTTPQQFRNIGESKITVEHSPDNNESIYLFHATEEKLNNRAHVPICNGNQYIPAVTNTSSHISILTEVMYRKLRSEGVESLELELQNAVLVTAFGNKTKRIRVQAMMQIGIDDIAVDHIVLISP